MSNPYPGGSVEAREWARIHTAPSWHQRTLEARAAALVRAAQRVEPAPQPEEVEHHAGLLRRLSGAGVIFGPDVSQYQGRPNFATVKAAGCALAWRKATEGRTFADPSGEYNRAAIPKAGLVGGAYHYLYFSQEYADKPALWGAQADWFAHNVDASEGHALDVEAAASAGAWLGVREWVAEYRRLFPNHPLGGYFNRSLWRNRSRVPYDPAGLFDYVWHAGIGDGYYTAAAGSIAAEWTAIKGLSNSAAGMGYPVVELWQISDHATVPGISGTCDGNAYQGSAGELAALLTGRHTPKPPTPPAKTHPPFPLPKGGFFGPGGVMTSPKLAPWQKRMKDRGWGLVPDGVYGPQTQRVARTFQTEKHLHVDARIGPATWDAAWTTPVTSAGQEEE